MTGTSVLGLKYDGGVMLAADNLGESWLFRFYHLVNPACVAFGTSDHYPLRNVTDTLYYYYHSFIWFNGKIRRHSTSSPRR